MGVAHPGAEAGSTTDAPGYEYKVKKQEVHSDFLLFYCKMKDENFLFERLSIFLHHHLVMLHLVQNIKHLSECVL